MKIESKIERGLGDDYDVIYVDSNNVLENIGNIILEGVHGFCFYKDKMVLVYSDKKGYWSLPGGGIELGETYTEALIREIHEETNMKVLYQELLGYQDIYQPNKVVRQTRSFCIVEPYGNFVSDPDEDITKIKLIDTVEFRKYINWGKIGDHLISRAIKQHENFSAH